MSSKFCAFSFAFKLVEHPEGLEPPAYRFVICDAIHLHHGCSFKVGATGLEPAFSCSQSMWVAITLHPETWSARSDLNAHDALLPKQVAYH